MTRAKSNDCYDKADNCPEIAEKTGGCHRHGKESCEKVLTLHSIKCDRIMFRAVASAKAIPPMRATATAMTLPRNVTWCWTITATTIRMSAKR